MSCCEQDTYDISVYVGADFSQPFFYLDPLKAPINLTGYTAKMQVRQSAYDSNIIAELTTENDGITIDPLLGKITLFMDNSLTGALTAGNYVYDFKLISPANFESILFSGIFSAVEAVTR